jgi:hypothetical protein
MGLPCGSLNIQKPVQRYEIKPINSRINLNNKHLTIYLISPGFEERQQILAIQVQ